MIHAYDLEMCQTVWRDRKSHGAGVTAIMLRENDNTLLTGSYDDILRVFDSRTRRIVTELEMGGGVWRLDNQGNNSVVVSCMYAGAAVVDLGEGGRSPSIAKKFEEHESMNYGCSIHPSDLNTVVSCSFYDKRLCIWNINS